MKVIFLLFFTTLITSCVSAPPYVPPTDGPLAKLIMPSSKSSYRFLGGVTSTNMRFAVDSGNNCSIFSKPVVGKDGAKTVEITIPGNKTAFVKTEFTLGNSACASAVSFEPEKNKNYTVVPGYYGKFCTISIFTEADNKKLIPVEVETAFVDSWYGSKVCNDRNNI